jgi:hypothetical protein
MYGPSDRSVGLPASLRASEYLVNCCVVGKPEVIRFIRHAARWRRFFRCSLTASNFRSRSV